MLDMKRILVPVDFSERSLAAAKQAAALAKRFGSQLTVAHVIDRFPYEGTELELFYGENGEVISAKELDTRFRDKLHKFTTGVAGDLKIQEVLLKGDPAKEIADFAEEQAMNMVVIPTHGRGRFRQFLLGSVTAKVLHDVTCPVFTGVHTDAAPFAATPAYRRIGCAVDLARESTEVMRWARDFALTWGAELFVIHATPFAEVRADDLYIVTVDWRNMLLDTAKDKVQKLAAQLDCRPTELCIADGHPVHFVTAVAEEKKLDALVIGRGLAKQRASRLPTHAYGIIREAPCPVISLS